MKEDLAASYKNLKEVTTDLKKIYTANTEEVAYLELKSFAAKWDDKCKASNLI